MNKVPNSHMDLLRDDARAYAYLATVMGDGTPQVTPVWFNTQGETILINSARGRIKDRNMRARPGVAILIADPHDPLRYVQVRGRIVRTTQDGALEHISTLSMKYRGRRWDPVPGQIRVIYSLRPEHVSVA
jgi:PPOX class probable F420-dependent enzyme